jgi:spore maturation protein CgeB
MNMRFFELMAMGAFQICNIVHGQELFGFEDRVHLANYIVDEDLINTVNEFLRGGDESFLVEKRNRIAQAGKQKVLAEHTYQHRAEEILRVCGLC